MFDISEKPKLVEKAFLIGVFHTLVEKEPLLRRIR